MAATEAVASTCRWCREVTHGIATTCTRCGAALTGPIEQTSSGWLELPALTQHSHLQIGRSSLIIEGDKAPCVFAELAGDVALYTTHHHLVWLDPSIRFRRRELAGWTKRVFAGLPAVLLDVMGPGSLGLASDGAGQLVPVPLDPGGSVQVRGDRFLAATDTLGFDFQPTNVRYVAGTGDDATTHFPMGRYLDRFFAHDRPGMLLLHAEGDAFVRTLQEGETLLVSPGSFLYKDPSVGHQLVVEKPRGARGRNMGFNLGKKYVGSGVVMWLRMWGPGRVAVESTSADHVSPWEPIYVDKDTPVQEW